MHLFLVDSHSFGIHSIISLSLSLSHLSHLVFQHEDPDLGRLAGVPGGPGAQRGVAPGARHPGAAGHEGDGQLGPRESHHLGLSHPRFDLINTREAKLQREMGGGLVTTLFLHKLYHKHF